MYKLTLTKSERAAIDWVAYRYFHGDELSDILMQCIEGMDDVVDNEWNLDGDITFNIPEHRTPEA